MKNTIILLLIFICTGAIAQRDVEVNCFTKYGTAFLRAKNGRAIYFSAFGEGNVGILKIGIVEEMGAGVLPEDFKKQHLLAYVNYDVSTTNFTFGVSGMEVYAIANGKEIARFKTIEQMESGEVLLRGNGSYQVYKYGVKALPTRKLYSKGKVIDARDITLQEVATWDCNGYTFHYPSKTFKFTAPVYIEAKSNLVIQGSKNTVLDNPFGFFFMNCPGLQINNLTFKSNNAKANINYGIVTLAIHRSDNSSVRNLKFTNPVNALQFQYCRNVSADQIDVTSAMGNSGYYQWSVQFGDSYNCRLSNASFKSGTLTGAFEGFKCDSLVWNNITAINGVMAMNGSQRFHVTDAQFCITENSQPANKWFSAGTSIVNVNTNAGANVDAGGTLENICMNVSYINKEKDLLQGIVVDRKNPNVKILGGSYVSERPATKWRGAIISSGNVLIDNFKTSQEIRVEN